MRIVLWQNSSESSAILLRETKLKIILELWDFNADLIHKSKDISGIDHTLKGCVLVPKGIILDNWAQDNENVSNLVEKVPFL